MARKRKKKSKAIIPIIITLIILGLIIAGIFLFLSKEKEFVGLDVHYYRDGVEIFQGFISQTFIDPPGESFDQISFDVSATNTGDVTITNMKVVDAYPDEFLTALPTTTQTLAKGETDKLLWASGLMNASDFELISPVNFMINISWEHPALGTMYYAGYSGDISFEAEKLEKITSPTEDEVISGTAFPICWEVLDGYIRWIKYVEGSSCLGGSVLVQGSGEETECYDWDTTMVQNGDYCIKLVDTTTIKDSVMVTVDNPIKFTSPTEDEIISGTTLIEWGNSLGYTGIYLQYGDGLCPGIPGTWHNLVESSYTSHEIYSWDTTTVPNGDYCLRLRGVNIYDTVSVTVDNEPPVGEGGMEFTSMTSDKGTCSLIEGEWECDISIYAGESYYLDVILKNSNSSISPPTLIEIVIHDFDGIGITLDYLNANLNGGVAFDIPYCIIGADAYYYIGPPEGFIFPAGYSENSVINVHTVINLMPGSYDTNPRLILASEQKCFPAEPACIDGFKLCPIGFSVPCEVPCP